MSEAERFAPSLSLMRPRRARVVLGRLRVPGAMRSIRRASLAAGTAVKSRVGVGSGAGVAALREAGAFLAVVVVAGDLVAAARGEGVARVVGAVGAGREGVAGVEEVERMGTLTKASWRAAERS